MLRMCINFRMVNKQIKIDAYPTPQNYKILDFLCKARVSSKTDLSEAYNQVAVELSYIEKTAFLTK